MIEGERISPKTGRPVRVRRPDGTGTIHHQGYVVVRGKLQHVIVAEKALGKPLPPGAEVHHVDENKANNDPSNLVICPSTQYHRILHQRAKALAACGNAGWKKCVYCQQWDDPKNMWNGKSQASRHRACQAEYYRKRKAAQ